MKLITLLVIFLGIPRLLFASSWEACLDKADFDFSAGTFVKSVKSSKLGCEMRFIVLGGKGERYEINLCDPRIHIDQYASLDADTYTRHFAGSIGCPKPLFGAEFDEEESPGSTSREFAATKAKVFDIFSTVAKTYGPNANTVDISNPNNFSPQISDAKIACARYLLTEYLENCVAFEAPKREEKAREMKPLPPGVHPATIPTK